MNPWETLGIGPTREERDIRRAYTRLLRKYPPESDPEGFKSLRSAYDYALFLSKLPPGAVLHVVDPATGGAAEGQEGRDASNLVPPAASSPVPLPPAAPSSVPDPAGIPESSLDPDSSKVPSAALLDALSIVGEAPPADGEPAWLPEAKAFLDRIAKDFPIHAKRQFADYWTEVLQADALWNLDAKAWIGWNLFGFIGRQNLDNRHQATEVHINKDAWILIDDTFGWLEGESSLYGAFPEDHADAVLDPIRQARGLKTAADMNPPPVRAIIQQQNEVRRHEYVRYLAIPAILLIVNLLRECTTY